MLPSIDHCTARSVFRARFMAGIFSSETEGGSNRKHSTAESTRAILFFSGSPALEEKASTTKGTKLHEGPKVFLRELSCPSWLMLFAVSVGVRFRSPRPH